MFKPLYRARPTLWVSVILAVLFTSRAFNEYSPSSDRHCCQHPHTKLHDISCSSANCFPTLSAFLESKGLDNSRTIFLTIASNSYLEPMINFRRSLEKWSLGENYVALCLDVECVQAANAHNITAYDGYLMTAKEAQSDWHLPVGRMKVWSLLTF